MNHTQIAPLQPGYGVQLPADWAKDLGLQDKVALHKTSEGILVRPCPPENSAQKNWDDVFATKLIIGSARLDAKQDDEVELTGDDFL
jgi:hypothetical protein